MEYDNPAARLLSLLEKCKQKPGHMACKQAWREILDTGKDAALLMSRLGKVMELSQVTIEALRESFPNRETTWSHWNSQVNSAFMNQNLSATWDTFINHIDHHTIVYLQLSSDLLQGKSTTKLLENEKLNELRDELTELCDSVINSSLSSEIKKYITRALRKLVTNIDEYRLTGALPLLEAVEGMVGHACVDVEYKEFMQTNELGRKLLVTLGAIADAVTVAIGIPQLSHSIGLLQIN